LPNGTKVHAFGVAALCWVIYKTRNKACFDGKYIKCLLRLFFYACALYAIPGRSLLRGDAGAGLYLGELQVIEGVRIMMQTATAGVPIPS
jgi:hypothetical protein